MKLLFLWNLYLKLKVWQLKAKSCGLTVYVMCVLPQILLTWDGFPFSFLSFSVLQPSLHPQLYYCVWNNVGNYFKYLHGCECLTLLQQSCKGTFVPQLCTQHCHCSTRDNVFSWVAVEILTQGFMNHSRVVNHCKVVLRQLTLSWLSQIFSLTKPN